MLAVNGPRKRPHASEGHLAALRSEATPSAQGMQTPLRPRSLLQRGCAIARAGLLTSLDPWANQSGNCSPRLASGTLPPPQVRNGRARHSRELRRDGGLWPSSPPDRAHCPHLHLWPKAAIRRMARLALWRNLFPSSIASESNIGWLARYRDQPGPRPSLASGRHQNPRWRNAPQIN